MVSSVRKALPWPPALQELPLLEDTTFSFPGGLAATSYVFTQGLLQGTINAPLPLFPLANANSTMEPLVWGDVGQVIGS